MENVNIKLEVTTAKTLSYTYFKTGRSLVNEIKIQNIGDEETTGMLVRPRVCVVAPGIENVISPWEGPSRELPRPKSQDPIDVTYNKFRFGLNTPALGELVNSVIGQVIVEILNDDDDIIDSVTKELLIISPKDWIDDGQYPDSLAAFVNPGDEIVQSIVSEAREWLQNEYGSGQIIGDNGGPEHVFQVAEAIYEIIRSKEINYTYPEKSDWRRIQRIRTNKDILIDDKAGTCLDTSVLYAACLLEAHINPLLCLVEGHAFTGFFVNRDPDTLDTRKVTKVLFDPVEILALHNSGFIQTVETTLLCGGIESKPFNTACDWQSMDEDRGNNGYLSFKRENLERFINVSLARNRYLSPPVLQQPSENIAEDSFQFYSLDEKHDSEEDLEILGLQELESLDLADDEDRSVPPRVRQWMSGLLDLSTRNNLLKMKVGRKGLLNFDLPAEWLDKLDDELFDGKTIPIKSPAVLPRDWWDAGIKMNDFQAKIDQIQTPLIYPSYTRVNKVASEVEQAIQLRDRPFEQIRKTAGEKNYWEALQKLTDADIEHRIHSLMAEEWNKELNKALQKLVTEKTEQMLLTGNNPLFLTLGSVSWEEEPEFRGTAKKTYWSAPLYLYPIILEGGKGIPYTIRLDDHGTITPNYCLQEKLRRDPIGLLLPELTTPETDDLGIDVAKNINSIEAKIREKKLKNFVVERNCRIGIFDYTNFLLWRDLKDDWEKMRDTSEAVKHLMYTPTQQFAGAIPDLDDDLTLHCPHPTDDSQRQAISWALNGRSFRLEGPPGTGKTQTITNLIASCLAHKKKILFVAEKSTALQQVKERLYEVGLGNFCLELHAKGDSDTRIRSNIRAQLTEAVGSDADSEDKKWEDLNHALQSEENFLDEYVEAVHSSKEGQYSFWSAYQESLSIGEGETIVPSDDFLDGFNDYWPDFRVISEELPEKIRIADGIQGNMWLLIQEFRDEEVDKTEFKAALDRLDSVRQEFEALQGNLAMLHDFNNPFELLHLETAIELLEKDLLPPHSELLLMGTTSWKEKAQEVLGKVAEESEALSHISEDLNLGIFNRSDFDTFNSLMQTYESANLFTRGKARKTLITQVGEDAKTDNTKKIPDLISIAVSHYPTLITLQELFRDELGIKIPDLMFFTSKEGYDELVKVVKAIESLTGDQHSEAFISVLKELSNGNSLGQMQKNQLKSITEAWRALFQQIVATPESGIRWVAGRALLKAWSEDSVKWADDSQGYRFLELDRWGEVLVTAHKLNNCHLGMLINQILDGAISTSEMKEQVERGCFISIISRRMQEGNLDRFDRKVHEKRIATLEKTHAELSKLTQSRVPGLVVGRRPKLPIDVKGQFGDQGKLLAALKPIRKAARKPIRTLVEKYGEVLSDAMPCFLMSPESVATLLPVGAIEFDLVIFDEASQIRTSHAVGALGRGKANIVVGDSKQMPPSKMFTANHGRDIEDDDPTDQQETSEGTTEAETNSNLIPEALIDLLPSPESASDAESILEEFEASQLPYMQLLCHYRSKDELLIAFSNSHVYTENPMMTFPSIKGLNSDALKWVETPQGQFHRNKTDVNALTQEQQDAYNRALQYRNEKELIRTNPIEAFAVSEELWKRLSDPVRQKRREEGASEGHESVIVVTFNKPQKDLIHKIITENPDYDTDLVNRAFQEVKDEESGVLVERPQLKIVNLEHVQGDEAETVIFTTAFTKQGPGHPNPDSRKVPTRWGPVSDPGGYRRLNVAVTRAKKEMLVFCSFDPLDIDIKESSSENIRLVQSFLLLAKNGPKVVGDVGIDVARNQHVADIAEEIEKMGYRVKTQVGLSSLRVDIAVGEKESDSWKLAILIDGPNWAERGSAVQREVLPKNMLGALGWSNVIRIWLPGWMVEKKKILTEIKKAMNSQKPVIPTPPKSVKKPTRKKKVTNKSSIPLFTPFNPEKYAREVLKHDPATGGWGSHQRQWGYGHDAKTQNLLRSQVKETIKAVLEKESPIEHQRLGKLVAQAWGYQNGKKERQFVLDHVDQHLFERSEYGYFVWRDSYQRKNFDEFRPSDAVTNNRKIDEIHPKELVNGLVYVLQALGSLERDEAAKVISKQFGINRLTQKVKDHIEKIILYANIREKKIVFKDNKIALPK